MSFHILCNAIANHKNWEWTTKILWYCALDNEAAELQAKISVLKAKSELVMERLDSCRH